MSTADLILSEPPASEASAADALAAETDEAALVAGLETLDLAMLLGFLL